MRTSIKYVLIFFAIVAILGIGLTLVSGEADARLCVWDGGGADALASNPLNWDGNVTPVPNDNILFDGLNATGDDTCTWDSSNNSFGTFTIGAGYSGVITQSSDMYIQGYSQAGGTFTGVTTKWVYLNGNFIRTAGTITNDVLCLILTADDSILNIGTSVNIPYLKISGDVTATTGLTIYSGVYPYLFNFYIDPDCVFTINADSTVNMRGADVVFTNLGTIQGSGIVTFSIRTLDKTVDFGVIYCPIVIASSASSNANGVYYMGGDSVLGVITIVSGHATYTCTLNLNGHSLTASTITVGTRGILSNTGADSLVTCTSFDSSTAATAVFTGTNIDLVFTGTGTFKIKSTEAPEDITFNGATTIYQNTKLTGILSLTTGHSVTDGAGAYRINVTSAVSMHDLMGTWDMPIYFDGTAIGYTINTLDDWGTGTVFFNDPLAIDTPTRQYMASTSSATYGNITLDNTWLGTGGNAITLRYDVPSTWASGLTLRSWDSNNLSFELNGNDLVGTNLVIGSHAKIVGAADITFTNVTISTNGTLDIDGTINCHLFHSLVGTFLPGDTTIVMTNGTITAAASQQFDNILITGTVDMTNDVDIISGMKFVNVDASYDDLDVLLDGTYYKTIPTPYNVGLGILPDGEYSYIPDIQIEMSQFYEDTDFSIYAYISTNLPVTYNITGTASDWLSYHEGRITGMPPEIGNYTYTITATHESGSVDIVNGYILVGQLDTAEYNFDFIWGLLLWSVISLFMLFAFIKEIPLMQMVVWAISFGNIVATIRIDNFAAFVALFAICNTIMFFIGMARWRSD